MYILLLFLAWCLTASIWPFVESDYPGPMLPDNNCKPHANVLLSSSWFSPSLARRTRHLLIGPEPIPAGCSCRIFVYKDRNTRLKEESGGEDRRYRAVYNPCGFFPTQLINIPRKWSRRSSPMHCKIFTTIQGLVHLQSFDFSRYVLSNQAIILNFHSGTIHSPDGANFMKALSQVKKLLMVGLTKGYVSYCH